MTIAQDLQQERSDVQERRQDHAGQQRILRDLDMIRRTLRAHVGRLAREAEPTRTPGELAEHVERLLRRHESGERRLATLEKLARDQELRARVRRARETGPLVEIEPPGENRPGVEEPAGEEGAFATAFVRYLRGEVERRAVTEAFERDVRNPDGARSVLHVVDELHAIQSEAARGARDALNRRLADHVGTLERADADPGADPLAALGWQAPALMLPVRLETRFERPADDPDGAPTALMVRVYPDQVHVDTHEDALTDEEREWGRTFWAYLWLAAFGRDAELDEGLPGRLREDARAAIDFDDPPEARYRQVKERAWAQGVERFGAERAAYVVHTLTPLPDEEEIGDRLLRGWENGEPPVATDAPLAFPDVDLRSGTWTQTPTARLLPDRWVAYAFYAAADGEDGSSHWQVLGDRVHSRRAGDELVLRVTGNPIREPLPVAAGPDPSEEDEVAWMLSFEEAKAAGMGLTIPLPDDSSWTRHQRFSRLIVMGVRTSMNAVAASGALYDRLLAAQYTDGLELLNPGAPTNNADQPSAHSTRRTAAESLETAVGRPRVKAWSDGARLASALGIPARVFAHVAGADDTRQQDARAMNAVLWPATLGYYARNLWQTPGASAMLGATRSDDGDGVPPALRRLETYHQHFVDFVRAGGPFPTLRIGRQPYGMLPVSPLGVQADEVASGVKGAPWASWDDEHVPRVDDGEFQSELARHLWSLRRVWLRSADSVPSVADDPALSGEALLTLFSQEPVAYAYRRQMWLLGKDHPLFSALPFLGREDTGPRVRELLEQAGIEYQPRIAEMAFLGAWRSADDLPIADRALRSQITAISELLTLTLRRSLRDIRGPLRDTLLGQLVGLATLEAVIASRVRLGAAHGDHLTFPPEPTSYAEGADTIFDALEDPLPGTNDSYEDAVRQTAEHVSYDSTGSPPDPTLAAYLRALRHLGGIDAERLTRLTTETLDLASHRLDAWWTSLATRRLLALRGGAVTPPAPSRVALPETPVGVHIGAFGFVENLRAGSGPGGEYLLAPSLEQATTASILRAAHKSRAAAGDPQAEALAVNLTAPRVRKARRLFEAVRRGLPLGEVLGYRFERGLHEAGLERYIHPFRRKAPSIEGKMGKGDSSEDGQQSDVVDGLQLYRKWKEESLATDFVASEHHEAVEGLFQTIDDTMDAAHDLLLAEAVHHMVHGRPERAASALEAMSRAGYPPITEVMDTPRTEAGVNHRLLVMFGGIGDNQPPDGWRPPSRQLIEREELPTGHLITPGDYPLPVPDSGMGPAGLGGHPFGDVITLQSEQVRRAGEPNLDAWVGRLLPSADRIGCVGEFRWVARRSLAVGTFETPGEKSTITVSGVGFRPDVILFTAFVPAGSGGDWMHGAYRRGTDGAPHQQAASSITVDENGSATLRAHDQSNAVAVTLRGDGTITGEVTEVHADGFELAFRSVGQPVTVVYRALQTINPRAVEIRTSDPAGAGTDALLTGEVFGIEVPELPVTGETSGPTDGHTLDVSTGFRPGLMDLFVLDGGGTFRLLYGAARSRAVQHWIGEGPTPRVSEVRDDGFTLDLSEMDATNLRVLYRAWPTEPAEVDFSERIAITLDELRLTPLDAIAITQAPEEEGDSQLERRIAYHAFRHLPEVPDDRPPIPPGATLSLKLGELPDVPNVDVTVAEYIEAAHAIRDLIGEARPADARDLIHPGEATGEGYFAGPNGTAMRLQTRADQVQGTLGELRTMLRNRIALLGREHGVTAQVDEIVEGARRLRRQVPLATIRDRVDTVSAEGPSLLDELRIIADHLRTGPTEPDSRADLQPAAGGPRTLTPPVTLDPGTKAMFILRSYSDAVYFEDQKTENGVTAGPEGTVSAEFDFSDVPPGTAFTLSVEVPGLLGTLPDLPDFLDLPGLLGLEAGGRDVRPPWSGETYTFNGRVGDAPNGGKWHDLSRKVADELSIVPALLWLDRCFPDLRTDGGANRAGEALNAALDAADPETIKAEIGLMGKVLRVLQAQAREQRAFTQADMKAVEALEALLALDLDGLTGSLEAALEPLRWTGLDRLLNTTGPLDRPDRQRVWRATSPDVQTLVPKHGEGEVRARLERLRAYPEMHDAGVKHHAYSRVFRHVLKKAGVEESFVEALEQLLADPVAAGNALTGLVEEPLLLVHRLHTYMHHGETRSGPADRLADQLEALSDRIGNGEVRAEIADLVNDPGTLAAGISRLVPQIRKGAGEGSQPDLDGSYGDTLDALRASAKEQLGLVLDLPRHPDPAHAFRAGVLEGLRQVLLRASYFGVYGSTPASAVGGTPDDERTLLSQARNVTQELTARWKAAGSADPDDPPTVAGQVRRLKAMLGDDFTVLPPFIPGNLAELHETFAASDALLQDDVYAPDTWLQRISRVREHPALLQKVRTYANAFALSERRRMQPRLVPGQLPHGGGPWVGRDGVEPQGGELVFGVDFVTRHEGDGPMPPPANHPAPVAGLFIDGWVVGIPHRKETIGVGLQYDDPSSRAPQSVLLAVPPAWKREDGDGSPAWQPCDAGWTQAALLRTIQETMELMRVRSVDLEALESLGHVLPALCFPYNVSTVPGSSQSDAPTVHFDHFDWS